MKVTRPPAHDPVVQELCAEQQAELAFRQRDVVDDTPKHLDPRIAFVLLWSGREGVGGQAVGCAGLQPLEPGVGEVKRMYVRPAARGRGLSRRLLTEVEAMAGERGIHTLRLETGRLFTEAIGLYTAAGYVRIPRFGPYAGCAESVCFEKRLGAPQDAATLGA
ncbi:GNAT family N-acetyltransferase [Nonomuraea rhodomycinica]|uniref:GNAT family N-acetyltransferase n=1 Tax=Nonomuraea rhodomycinica TaxID=1712872 RepID=A0A7Y6IMC6_9ACTN|nr:GNAT family N-acetyltransferase [Nonomuraea rhodomycinica]NUW40648.1 GNAT family N-acetyltransferase [Nonomuraea rhodomycinica]